LSNILKIKFIGLGGIGTILGNTLFQFLNFYMGDLSEDVLKVMGNPNRYSEIQTTLIDGDTYEPRNRERQVFSVVGPKCEVKEKDFREEYDRISFTSINQYVNEQNVSQLIQSGDIVLLCVDNHETRKIVGNYCQTLNDIRLYAGGNAFHTSSVQAYWRENGKDIKPNICKYHPEIAKGDDFHPEGMGCEDLHSTDPQLIFANASAAKSMWELFYAEIILGMNTEISDIYGDIVKCTSLAKRWKP